MIARLSALAAGFVFGMGLWLSGMTDPARVLGFLDVGGRWDPSLLFVLGGAVGVTLLSFRVVLRRPAPALGGRFDVPARRQIDRDLLLGSALFGAGWGLGGLCPGPALSSLPTLAPGILVFVLAMVVGGFVYGPAKRTDRS